MGKQTEARNLLQALNDLLETRGRAKSFCPKSPPTSQPKSLPSEEEPINYYLDRIWSDLRFYHQHHVKTTNEKGRTGPSKRLPKIVTPRRNSIIRNGLLTGCVAHP